LERRVPPLPRALPLRHRYYQLVRQTHLAFLCFDFWSRSRKLCRLLPAPAASGFFPTLSLRIFPVMPGPLSRRLADCTYLVLPLPQRPSPLENGSAYRNFPLKRLHSGAGFRDCSHFFMFKPHSLLATLIAPTTTVSRRAVGDFYIRAERALLPPHAPNMLAVRLQVIDSTGTFTLQNSQPCRPLPSRSRFNVASRSVVRFRPAPSRRIRCIGGDFGPAFSSAMPRMTVPRDKPLARATMLTPPKPIAAASAAATNRRVCSSSTPARLSKTQPSGSASSITNSIEHFVPKLFYLFCDGS
jgi:hypothetical protein